MRIDIVSVFPEYFNVFDLSLLGKAKDRGLLTVHSHNLRDWTHDMHHSVDDTPVGGGAGMVMKPEVWAECLDDLLGLGARDAGTDHNPVVPGEAGGDHSPVVLSEAGTGGDHNPVVLSEAGTGGVHNPVVLSEARQGEVEGPLPPTNPVPDAAPSRPILIFPNPSAPLFTQEAATELSHADRLVFGCGRYEGYDARVPEYYRAQGFDVREYSIGDYVLNGGEVAVSVMVEAITRLLPGFMGNPDSIVEESYTGEPLLEHRQYTKPATWRGMKVPDVLLSGDHGKVDRYRRDESLARTTEVRPDLVERLNCRMLSKADRKTLMALGWNVSGEHPKR